MDVTHISFNKVSAVRFDWLSRVHLTLFIALWADEAHRKPRECKLMFERYTRAIRERYGAATENSTFTSTGRFVVSLSLSPRERSRDQTVARTETRLQKFVLVGGCIAVLQPLQSSPLLRIMSSFVSPLLEKKTKEIYSVHSLFFSFFYFFLLIPSHYYFSSRILYKSLWTMFKNNIAG